MSTTWALQNPLKAWTLYSLTEQEVRLLLVSFSENEIKLAKICRKLDEKWVPLDRVRHARFFDKTACEKYSETDGFPTHAVHGGTSVTETEYFIVKPTKTVHQRQHKRHELKVPCSVIGFNKEFQTETIDLSEGGLCFKDLIPSWVAGYFLVLVNSQFQLMCSLVEDQKEKKRVQIVSEENDPQFSRFREWLKTV